MNKIIKENIEYEISQIDKLFNDTKPLFDLCKLKEPDFIEIIASGAIIHSFYNGVEGIILLIDKGNGENIINNTKWHIDLFERAFEFTEKRPAIFKKEYKEDLKDYLSFRHFFRHAYSYNIKWDKLKPLLNNVNNIWEIIKNDINNHIKNTLQDDDCYKINNINKHKNNNDVSGDQSGCSR